MKDEQYKSDLIRIRGYQCEYCHFRRATELHHALIPRMKGKPELDCAENYMCACHECHVGKELLDTHRVREWFWNIQVRRYGHDHMIEWLKRLPLKIKFEMYR